MSQVTAKRTFGNRSAGILPACSRDKVSCLRAAVVAAVVECDAASESRERLGCYVAAPHLLFLGDGAVWQGKSVIMEHGLSTPHRTLPICCCCQEMLLGEGLGRGQVE